MSSKCDRNGHDWGTERNGFVQCRVCHLTERTDTVGEPEPSDDEEWD